MNEEVFIEKFELLKEQVLESSAFQGWQSFFVPIKDVGEESSTLGPFQGTTCIHTSTMSSPLTTTLEFSKSAVGGRSDIKK